MYPKRMAIHARKQGLRSKNQQQNLNPNLYKNYLDAKTQFI